MKSLSQFFLLTLFLLFIAPTAIYSQSKINSSKENLNKNKTEQSKSADGNNSAKSSDQSKGDKNDEPDGLGYEVVKFLTVGIFIGYKSESHLYNKLTAYPGADQSIGNYKNEEVENDKGIFIKEFRTDLGNQFMINEDVVGNHFKLKIRPFRAIYFQADYIQLRNINLN